MLDFYENKAAIIFFATQSKILGSTNCAGILFKLPISHKFTFLMTNHFITQALPNDPFETVPLQSKKRIGNLTSYTYLEIKLTVCILFCQIYKNMFLAADRMRVD